MAPMKYSPVGRLYSDSTEEEEEEEEEQKEEQNLINAPNHHKQQSTKQSNNDDDDEEEEEEEEEEETPPVTPEKKISNTKPISTVAPPQSQSSSATDADEGSGSDTDSRSDFTVKPILSTPARNSGNLSRTKKVASTSAAKRPAENQDRSGWKGKKARVLNGDEDDLPVEEKKFAINRLWSEEDEIVLLQGMIDYQLKKGVDPYADLGNFYEFVKGLVHVDVSKNQLTDKIRRLKKKYQNNADKGENGEDPVFSRPHEYKSFDLSKKIWGSGNSNGVDDGVECNNLKSRKSVKVDNIINQEEPLKEDFWAMYPQLNESLNLEKSIYLSRGKNFLKENMRLIGSNKARELDKKWRDLFVGELELYSKRLELIEEQTKLVLDAIKSSKS